MKYSARNWITCLYSLAFNEGSLLTTSGSIFLLAVELLDSVDCWLHFSQSCSVDYTTDSLALKMLWWLKVVAVLVEFSYLWRCVGSVADFMPHPEVAHLSLRFDCYIGRAKGGAIFVTLGLIFSRQHYISSKLTWPSNAIESVFIRIRSQYMICFDQLSPLRGVWLI